MTLRSDLTTETEKALRDIVYDGGNGAMTEVEFTRYVRSLAETAVEVADQLRGPTLTTEAEANALPIGAIIRDNMGDARQKASALGWEMSGVDGEWGPTWVAFPAEVLWLPTEQEGESGD